MRKRYRQCAKLRHLQTFCGEELQQKIAQEGKNIAAKKHRFALAKKQG